LSRGAGLFAAIAALVVTIFLLSAPVPQDPAYHSFADTRSLFGIANFYNVVSNLPFLVVGAWGVLHVFRHADTIRMPGLELALIVFFSGVFLTAFGSSWYHLAPTNDILVWDRLPMSIGFAGLFAFILGDFVSPRLGRGALVPVLLAGVLTVEYWAYSESRGAGDLRPYAIVQFLPMLLIPVLLLLYRPIAIAAKYYWLMLLFYVLAKFAEHFDTIIFATSAAISGHSLKHVLAATTPATMLYALSRRRAATIATLSP